LEYPGRWESVDGASMQVAFSIDSIFSFYSYFKDKEEDEFDNPEKSEEVYAELIPYVYVEFNGIDDILILDVDYNTFKSALIRCGYSIGKGN
jgi:hypothetical protein